MNRVTAYPLAWPRGWPKTDVNKREVGRFQCTLPGALKSLTIEVQRLGGKTPVLSSNYTLGVESPKEPGVVAYFEYDSKQVAIPCDRWKRIEHNVRAIALTIEAMRGMERWGAKHMIAAMFSGFRALPERTGPDCWEVLGLSPAANEEQIIAAYRRIAKTAHPDGGGSTTAFEVLNQAKDIALATQRAA